MTFAELQQPFEHLTTIQQNELARKLINTEISFEGSIENIRANEIEFHFIYDNKYRSGETIYPHVALKYNHQLFAGDLLLFKKGDDVSISSKLLNWSPYKVELELVSISKTGFTREDRLKAQYKLLHKGEYCFIATACYGDYDAEPVITLRNFRDDTLLKTKLGQQLVDCYYLISPALAKRISHSDSLKKITKFSLINPVLWLINRKNKKASRSNL
jgi:hypothetical protein